MPVPAFCHGLGAVVNLVLTPRTVTVATVEYVEGETALQRPWNGCHTMSTEWLSWATEVVRPLP